MREVDTPSDALDLKTLRLLRVLLDTASVTRTAERMDMSQPATSRAVARLREVFGDPLVVRTRRGYVLTPRASELRPALDAALTTAEALLLGQRFDPATSTRRFTIATTDYGAATVVARASRRLGREAPHIHLELVPFDGETLRRLELGSIDLALWADDELPSDFHYRRLFIDDYACIMRHNHALARTRGRETLLLLANYPHVVMLYPGDQGLDEDNVPRRLGLGDPPVILRTPYFTSAPWFLEDTDAVMCVPSRVASRVIVGTKLVALALPAPELGFEYRSVWHERAHGDAGNRWLRELLREVVAEQS